MNISAKTNKDTVSFLKTPTFWAFFASFLYWGYLAVTTSMDIKFDAISFQNEGKHLYENGLDYFFGHTGHDIAYPLLITASHYVANLLALPSHFLIQPWIQVCFLLVTQLLLLKALNQFNVRQGIKTAVLFYFGFSPAIVNTAFSSWSEIVSLPFALAIVLASASAWQSVRQEKFSRAVFCSILLAILFACLSLSREIYRHIIATAFPLVFLLLSFKFVFLNKRKSFLVALMSATIFLSSYQLMLTPYKNAQAKYQTKDLFLSRGVAQLYGGTLVRAGNLSAEQILSFLAYVAGENVVKKFFGEEAFRFWYYQQYDYGPSLQQELESQNLPSQEVKKIFYRRILENLSRNPVQYAFLTAAEGMKMLFWESTRIGFVFYPLWLEKLFIFTPFKNTLRLGIFLLTALSFFFSVWFTCKNWHFFYSEDRKGDNEVVIPIIFFGLFIILSNIILYSPFVIETRYALPIAPIYLALIGLTAEKFCGRKGRGME